MSNTFIIRRGGKVTNLKNLGWLLRNWQKVKQIGFNYFPNNGNDGQLVAVTNDGTAYFCDYASLSVCWRFLDRPCFQGLPFTLTFANFTKNKSGLIIGDAHWKILKEMDYQNFCFALDLTTK